MRQQGKGNVVARIDEGVRTVPHLAALRALVGTAGDWAEALCGATPGDGRGGKFYAVASTEEEDNDASVIITASGVAWLRADYVAADVMPTYGMFLMAAPDDGGQEAVLTSFGHDPNVFELTQGPGDGDTRVTFLVSGAFRVFYRVAVDGLTPGTHQFRLRAEVEGIGPYFADLQEIVQVTSGESVFCSDLAVLFGEVGAYIYVALPNGANGGTAMGQLVIERIGASP
jgi:hypothetical protein